MMQWAHTLERHSAVTSNESCSRNPRVFQTPNAMPAAIQMEPTIIAAGFKFSHSARQIKNPRIGGIRLVSFFSSVRKIVTHDAAAFYPHERDSMPKNSASPRRARRIKRTLRSGRSRPQRKHCCVERDASRPLRQKTILAARWLRPIP